MKDKRNPFPKILFVSPGYKPVPDVAGGAVEHLMTQILCQNEKTPAFHFDLITIKDKTIELANFKHTNIIQIKDFRKTFFLRSYSFIINKLYMLFKTEFRYNYLGCKSIQFMSDDISFILVENDVNVFKQIVNLHPKKMLVFHMHNDFDTLGEMQKDRSSMKYVIDNANEIWTVSAYLKRHLIFEFGTEYEAKIRVLENCVDRVRFSPDAVSYEQKISFLDNYGIDKNDFLILYSGRILKQKGVLELLKACLLLPQSMNFKLVVCGDLKSANSEYRTELEKIADLLDKKVVFTGYIPQYEIQTAYAVSDIVAVPSQCQEAFCLTALEATCHCKPCVASISGGMADVLDESCAKMIPLNNDFIKNFAFAIQELYSDRNLYEKMAEKAGERSKLFPDEEKYFENFRQIANDFILREVHK